MYDPSKKPAASRKAKAGKGEAAFASADDYAALVERSIAGTSAAAAAEPSGSRHGSSKQAGLSSRRSRPGKGAVSGERSGKRGKADRPAGAAGAGMRKGRGAKRTRQ